MLTVNYITRPFFTNIALELIQELKNKCVLNVIIIISASNIKYLGIDEDESCLESTDPIKIEKEISDKLYSHYHTYLEGANVLCKYEEVKETSFRNTTNWIRFLSANKSVFTADLNILESLNIADWYFLFKIRDKKIYHIVHDPVAHTGERRKRLDILRNIYFKHIDKFILYSSFATSLFDSSFPKYSDKTITLKTPIYYSPKLNTAITPSTFKNKILFFGRISQYKGVELFYSAAAQLSAEFEDVLFIIAGKTMPNYHPDFLNNNPYKNIQILNQYIDSESVSQLMTDAYCCVLPYIDATQSGVIMTCYSYDLPVLVSDCPGLLEYCFDEINFSFKNGVVDDLVLKIRNILLNPDLSKNYRENIISYSKQNISLSNADKILNEAF